MKKQVSTRCDILGLIGSAGCRVLGCSCPAQPIGCSLKFYSNSYVLNVHTAAEGGCLLVAVAAVVVVASWLLQLCSAATIITSDQPYYMSKFIVIEYVISNFRFFFIGHRKYTPMAGRPA